ncbi:hypothetical protein CPLU01_14971 [Colletotrichum plurivorum]|uniref:Avirulence Effector AvrLm4-7 domain-containing protein n=1 Tax=Colletotrichum plurivorum TaxID=2175906 RepID=A0A8H6MXQ5_9PEZI|nr:hypothetical protein CPLU01_14971 [Colletotrichum plurivorum]
MHFATVLVAAVACATGVVADLHNYAWCADRVFKGIQESNPENNDATQAACERYRKRNTGNKQWDQCPDCTSSFRGDVRVCNSLGWHIGGDEWDYYCRQVGADMGKA